jgi:hypothetical protein
VLGREIEVHGRSVARGTTGLGCRDHRMRGGQVRSPVRGRGTMATMIDPTLRAEIHRLELALARRDPSGIDGGLGMLVADDFLEFGASGRAWDAQATRALLEDPPHQGADVAALEITEFEVTELGPDVLLATYHIQGPRSSNRSSIWVRRAGRWVMRFHQGTLQDRDTLGEG